jgi:hypothetical protein
LVALFVLLEVCMPALKDTEPLRPQPKTHLFALEWDNARLETMDEAERLKVHNAEGVYFKNGLVALNTGATFGDRDVDGMDALEEYFDRSGYYLVVYKDTGLYLTNELTVDRRTQAEKENRV